MTRSPSQLRVEVERIWRAGVAAVMPEQLIPTQLQVEGDRLVVADEVIDVRGVRRIAIVGAGKAAGAMAAAVEAALGPKLLAEKDVVGWVNVPADCLVATQRVHLHAARPAGVNEPRPEGVEGTRRILELVSSLGPADLCLCVLSGGGSALLPAPVPGISLDTKAQLTRLLSAAGANIEQLNAVRRQISLIKGGGLARACNAGRLITLIISDVLGDPLDVIASGPTVEGTTTEADALAVLADLRVLNEPAIEPVVRSLRERSARTVGDLSLSRKRRARDRQHGVRVSNIILANNATAVDAAGCEAERLGYSHAMISARASEGAAEEVGLHLAAMALRMRREPGPDCLISGGEPSVTLVDESQRGKGGRNGQLALAALTKLGDCRGIALLSGGTDGEDGPTDAAGSLVDEEVCRAACAMNLDASDFLGRNDSYNFFARAGGLFITGPTQTNACDLRVIAVAR